MPGIHYTVASIDGEYANLRDENGSEVFVALFLLPDGTDVGTKLYFHDLFYEIEEQRYD